MFKHNPNARLEVIAGSMFSGKTEELIRRIRRAEFANQKVSVFKHKIDDRMTIEYIHSHSGEKFKAIALENPSDIKLFLNDDTSVIAIDEVQFFSYDIIPVILELLEQSKRIIVAGLDLDFRGVPFGCMPALLALADEVHKLKAVCMVCGKDAQFSQRLIDGKAAKFEDPVIMVGAQEKYQARCRDCYIINQKKWNLSQESINE